MRSEVKTYAVPVVAFIILAAFSLRMQAFLTFPCPAGSDAGLRVKNAYLLSREWVNVTYPAFDATLSLLWIITEENTGGLILSTELFVSTVMAFSAASMYSASIHVFRDRRASILVAFLGAFSAPTYELVSFGSYPQGLSLFLVPLIFAIALNRNVKAERSRAVCLGALAASLLMMHFWSFAACTIAIALFSAAEYARSNWGKDGEEGPATFKILIIVPFLALLFSSPWWAPILPFLQKTLLYTPVGTTSIRGVGWRFERFFSPYWLYYVFLPAGLIGYHSLRRHRNTEGLTLVTAWFLTPFILMQGHLFGVGADYRRLWYYPMEPAMIVAGLGLSFTATLLFHTLRETVNHRFIENRDREPHGNRAGRVSGSIKDWSRILLAFSATLILVAVVFSPGWWAVREADASTRYYIHIKEPELGMMYWIGSRVQEDMEILSGGVVGWWIRGLARRHVISVIPRAFINVPWQISRTETVGILASEASFAIRNDWIQVRDSGPYWSGLNPQLSIKLGQDYRSVMHLNDTGIILNLSDGRKISLANIPGKESSWVSRDPEFAALRMSYEGETIEVAKTITLSRETSLADLELKIDGGRTDVQSITLFAYPDEDLRYSAVLAEGFEQEVGQGTTRYSTPSSRWFAVYDDKEDLCFVVKLDKESRVHFNVEEGGLLSFEFDLSVDEGKANIRIGGFPVEDGTGLRESIRQYLDNEGEMPDSEGTAGQVSTLDYLEALREYRIRIIVTRTVDKHARDPHLDLVFSTGRSFIFESP